jgi:DNA-binding ferritin-like protein
MDEAHELITKSLVLAALAHHWHLTTTSYAQHVTLGEVYLYCHTIADTLAEKLIGAGEDLPDKSAKFSFAFTPSSQAIKTLETFAQDFENLTDPPWLQNLAQEIQGELYGHLYKLKRLS